MIIHLHLTFCRSLKHSHPSRTFILCTWGVGEHEVIAHPETIVSIGIMELRLKNVQGKSLPVEIATTFPEEVTETKYQILESGEIPLIASDNADMDEFHELIKIKSFKEALQVTATRVLPYRRGTGQIFPTRFVPPSPIIKPSGIFIPCLLMTGTVPVWRCINRKDAGQCILCLGSACFDTNLPEAKAGWAIVLNQFETWDDPTHTFTSGRLEKASPFGDCEQQTSQRAILRAAVGALRYRYWPDEAHTSIVLATDSEYLVDSATMWVKGWMRNGWKTNARKPVKNRDL
ncbi:uncharacterized protein F4822DRAFT_397889 [Hypoxylon trugodes]|uniref:uncharacterized protein n=1 Tax=Hypoxylon trugodes TaxID=326681 RepID=UPI00218D1990|nr:uncharacterized protein F4822DRAFT_397889 [Hypoxylon trugodes]KAI1389326.1 hypothetical protein F4822DRAFT_397889 [Hypoxylon trugodes]